MSDKRKYIVVEIKPEPHITYPQTLKADIMNNKVEGCTPIGLAQMNQDIDGCISFLKQVKQVLEEGK